MTRYRIHHRTAYRYQAAVASGHALGHLVPRDTPSQVVRAWEVVTEPVADVVRHHTDGFGNTVTYLAVEHPHRELAVTASSVVDVDPPTEPGPAWGAPWEAVPDQLAQDVSTDGLVARAVALDSPLVTRAPALAAYAGPSFPPGRALEAAVRDLSARIFADFAFDPTFSDVTTPLQQVLEARRGVCQDFAHLALGCLRSLGLPARYVSGYLETEPPPGRDKLVGADASHAWAAVYLPGAGWLDIDPTNDQVPPRRHVTVAWGRDYGDVAPLRGVVFGPATDQELTVSVDVAVA